MGTLVILLISAPYTSESSHSAVQICNAAKKKGHEVHLHLFMDGAINANRHINTMDETVNYAKEIQKLVENGVEVTICPMCAQYRGVREEEDFIPGVKKMSLLEFTERVVFVDTFISLG